MQILILKSIPSEMDANRPQYPGLTVTHRIQLKAGYQACRRLTVKLLDELEPQAYTYQAHPDFSPLGWHLGHIAYTEELWLLQHYAGQEPLWPQYCQLFAADGLPKSQRCQLPDLDTIRQYLSLVRTRVSAYLETVPPEQDAWLWYFVLQHESQHCETMAVVKQLLTPASPLVWSPQSSPVSEAEMIEIAAGTFDQGYDGIDAQDNECPVHSVTLATYWIDRYPVTCGQYGAFIQAGGYQEPCWWSEAGWIWLQQSAVHHPLYWTNDPCWDDHPVCGVSWYEAEAYATFVGKRLPTEAEWEKAACWDGITHQSQPYPWGYETPSAQRCNHGDLVGKTTPVQSYPLGQSAAGCWDMLGNVWEWTQSWFTGYPGFSPYPYQGYSQIYFDGRHRVLKGGSWATRPWALRCSWRNWYHPHVRQVFAGFRCAWTDQP